MAESIQEKLTAKLDAINKEMKEKEERCLAKGFSAEESRYVALTTVVTVRLAQLELYFEALMSRP